MKVFELETPVLIIEKRVMEDNLRTMQRVVTGTGCQLRPHYKSHKCADFAKMQMEAGAKGITCAKLGEAEDLVMAGIPDVLIANQIVQPGKLRRLCELQRKARVVVCVDNADNIAALDLAAGEAGVVVPCYVEFNNGMNRCGANTFREAADLAKRVSAAKNLTFEGIQAYGGHMAHMTDPDVRRKRATETSEMLGELKRYLEDEGLRVREISGASSATAAIKAEAGVYTELQAGSYLLMDGSYGEMSLTFHNALFVLSSVISVNQNTIVTDAGMKACSTDQGLPRPVGFPEDTPISLSEEHGKITLPGHTHRIGDMIRYIPAHGCTTMNLYDEVYLVEGDEVVGRVPVTSRGKCR